MVLTPINPATGLMIDFSVEVEDVAFAAGIGVRAVRRAMARTAKSRRYKWHGRRLRFSQFYNHDLKPTGVFIIKVSSLGDKMQAALIDELRRDLAVRLAGYRP
ncbi:hypothetical protein [Methylorubrum suomiense]|uniref:hypothetical protein n=1 Tax=Methylorubrum suomiense TaxID=144191 RepID=UPI001EE1B31D|nr:hypothetical protein [Methylorubrum suomiense]